MAFALYRNYRPKRFIDLVGQDDIALTLRNQVAAARVGHAYLFTGIRGTGKTTFARILSKAVNCLNVIDGEPCGVCEICVGIDNGTILDVTEIDGASNNRVDDIRELRDETAYVPTVAKFRVYIIDEVHMLTANAFGALLKILEEPPEHVVFILATTEIQKVPATILSRCQRFDLKRISISDIAKYLMDIAKQTDIILEYDAALVIAQHADGAMRDALSILDTCASIGSAVDINVVNRLFGSSESEYLFAISKAVSQQDVKEILNLIDTLYINSLNPSLITKELISHYRNILVTLIGGNNLLSNLSNENIEMYSEVSKLYTVKQVIEILKVLKELMGALSTAVDKRLQLEICMIEISSNNIQPIAIESTVIRQSIVQNINSPISEPENNTITTPSKNIDSHEQKEEDLTTETHINDRINTLSEATQEQDTDNTKSDIFKRFDDWPKVLKEVSINYPMLYSFLTGSEAYVTNTHILIDCSDFARKSIRDNKEHAENIKNCITKATGINLPIGPYISPESENKRNINDDAIDNLISKATAIGVNIEVK